jgi:hypothetical protein
MVVTRSIVFGIAALAAAMPIAVAAADGAATSGSPDPVAADGHQMRSEPSAAQLRENAPSNVGKNSGESGSAPGMPQSQATDPSNRPKEMDPGKQQ